ncbi:MAG TPA: hypothetical protein VEA16_19330 [Vicinamibacterales bacterium]|nr:hypothetical protein [Vicinamibacterales bacterium]
MTESDRALLAELRRLLLQLHKTLIDWQRTDYERVHGRLQTTQLLNVMFNDKEFAWLRSMSGLIVRIDEALDTKPRPSDPPRFAIETGPLVAAARELVAPEGGSPYAQRYHAALQELPDAVLAHRDLITLLKLQRPASNA